MKAYHLFITAVFSLLLCGVLNAQAIQSGTFKASPDQPDYTLDKGTGDRSYTIQVKFDTPFTTTPTVLLAASSIDANTSGTNLRYDISANGVNTNGFSVVVKTWADSKLFTIGGNWIAVGGNDQVQVATKSTKPSKKGKK